MNGSCHELLWSYIRQPRQPFGDIGIEISVHRVISREIDGVRKDQINEKKKDGKKNTRQVALNKDPGRCLLQTIAIIGSIQSPSYEYGTKEGRDQQKQKNREPGAIHEKDAAVEQIWKLPDDTDHFDRHRRSQTEKQPGCPVFAPVELYGALCIDQKEMGQGPADDLKDET